MCIASASALAARPAPADRRGSAAVPQLLSEADRNTCRSCRANAPAPGSAPGRGRPLDHTVRGMSRENVEFVEGLFAGVAGTDKQTLLAALPQLIALSCDPEIEWIEHPDRA